MKVRDLCTNHPRTRQVLALLLLATLTAFVWHPARAGEGLVVPSAESLWPQWRARVTVYSSTLSPLNPWRLQEGNNTPRAGQGGALLGDYYFAQPSIGSFRASGGLMFGAMGGAPLWQAAASPRLGLAVQNTSAVPGAEAPGTVPYLGLGFTTAAWRNRLSLSADLGWVAEQPSAIGGVGRAIFGNQGWDTALRDIRLAPVLQLGVRYAF